MGNETILYYVTEESITGTKRIVKKHFFREIEFAAFLAEAEGYSIVTVMIPDVQKGWKKEKLLRLMKQTADEYTGHFGNMELLVQPKVWRLLTEAKQAAGQRINPEANALQDMFYNTVPDVFWSLTEKLLESLFAEGERNCLDTIVLLLTDVLFPEEQMRRFFDMLQLFFSHINHLTILYFIEETVRVDETDADAKKNDKAEAYWNMDVSMDSIQEKRRWEEAIADYTETLYLEYGLVCQVQQGMEFQKNQYKNERNLKRQTPKSHTLFLDFGYPGAVPIRAMKARDMYLDVVSSEKKEILLKRKVPEVSYCSPRKYLDTMVKSGYDK